MFEASRSYFLKSNHILIPMFRGINSIKALKLGFDFAEYNKAEITAITVREKSDSIEWSNSVTLVTNAYKDGKRRGLKVIPKIITSDSAKSGLMREADSRYYDLLIMATHKRAMLSGSVFGSIGDYMLKNIKMPLGILSVSEREYPYKKILLPISENINTRASVFFALELAKINRAKLIIFDIRKYDKRKTHGFKNLFDSIGDIAKNEIEVKIDKSGYNTNTRDEMNSIILSEDPDCVVIGARRVDNEKVRINADMKFIIKDQRIDTLCIEK